MRAQLVDLYQRLRLELGDIVGDADLPAKLTTMTVLVAEGDVAYVPDYLAKMLSSPEAIDTLVSRLCRDFADSSELHRLSAFVRSNAHVVPLARERLPDPWRAVWARLEPIICRDRDFAVATLCYGLMIALYEWKDRRRGAVPYDAALHGPIRMAEGVD